MPPTKIEISHRTIIFTVFFLISLWLLYQIRDILLVIFISSILMAALEPTVEEMEKRRIPRFLAVLLIYLFLVFLIGIAIAGVIPPLIDQTSILASSLPSIVQQLGLTGIDPNLLNNQISQLGSVPGKLFDFAISIFSNVISIFVLTVTTFYLLMERKSLSQYLMRYFGTAKSKSIMKVIARVEKRLGDWVRGEVVLMTIVGLFSYFGFRLLGLEFALPLAILSGLLEVMPNIGPTLATIPAVLAGLAVSPLHALATLAWCFLVQQIENNFIVPKVMQKATGLSPLVVIISLSIGFRLAGMGGAALAIPVVLALEIIFSEISAKKLQEA